MHYIYSMSFFVTFAIVASLTLYLGANEKFHAKPKYFFIAALASVLLGFGFKVANDTIENNIRAKMDRAQSLETEARISTEEKRISEAREKLDEAERLRSDAQFMSTTNGPFKQFVDLILLTSGAFAGALASAAITNRAKSMHDRRVLNLLRTKYLQRSTEAEGLANLINKAVSSSCDNENEFKSVSEKTAKLVEIVEELQLLSGQITQKEIDDVEFLMMLVKDTAKCDQGQLAWISVHKVPAEK